MNIDNLEKILRLIELKSTDEFFTVDIIQRRKDVKALKRNSVTFHSYNLFSKNELIEKYDEIKKLCNLLNARAMININPISISKTVKEIKFKAASYEYEGNNYKSYLNINKKCIDSKKTVSRVKDKYWMIDIDNKNNINDLRDYINNSNIRSKFNKIYIDSVPSKSGTHVIVKPFDTVLFYENLPDIIKNKYEIIFSKNDNCIKKRAFIMLYC